MSGMQTGNAGILESLDWVTTLGLALQVPGPLVPLVWGRSGIGKTRIGAQMAERLGWAYLPIALNTRTPSDIQGAEIPDITNPGRMVVTLPAFFDTARRLGPRGVLILLDEVGSLQGTMQGASLRLLSEKAIDGTEAGPHVRWFATANPPNVAAGAGEMPEAYAYRFTHIRAKPNHEQGARFMRGEPTHAQDFPVLDLEAFRASLPLARATVADYWTANPEHYEETEEQTEGRWPLIGANPRSWEQVAAYVAACSVTGRRDLLPPLVTGCIGSPVALPFLVYERTHDLPQPHADPAAWTPNPARPDRDLAILAAVKVWAVPTKINDADRAAGRKQPRALADRWLHGWAWVARAVTCNARAIVAQLGRALADADIRPETLPRDPDSIAAAKVAGTMIKTLAPILRHAGPAAE